jgi:hypothetical protein
MLSEFTPLDAAVETKVQKAEIVSAAKTKCRRVKGRFI